MVRSRCVGSSDLSWKHLEKAVSVSHTRKGSKDPALALATAELYRSIHAPRARLGI